MTSLFTPAQSIALVLVRPISSMLSLVGSAIIVSTVIRMDKTKQTPRDRILIVMSFYDILHSTASLTSTLPVVKSTGVFGAMGNRTTCEVQGFFIQISMFLPMYNACLALYYMLRICYNLSDKTVGTYVEPVFHILVSITGWTLAIFGWIRGLYNPIAAAELGCWVAAYPAFCTENEDLRCERGADFEKFVWIFSYFHLYFSFAIIAAANIRILWTVYVHERRLALHTTIPASSFSQERQGFRQMDPYRRSREVARANFGYVAGYLVTFVWSSLSFLVSKFMPSNVPLIYACCLLLQIFYPLQGFWNCFVFKWLPTPTALCHWCTNNSSTREEE